MKIKELLERAQKAHDKNPDADVGIWIWENYSISSNFDSCIAEDADITGIFKDIFIISCDKKGVKKPKYGARGPDK